MMISNTVCSRWLPRAKAGWRGGRDNHASISGSENLDGVSKMQLNKTPNFGRIRVFFQHALFSGMMTIWYLHFHRTWDKLNY
jgi:hypothetical protein